MGEGTPYPNRAEAQYWVEGISQAICPESAMPLDATWPCHDLQLRL